MERNWLIRTTQNQILGPISKAKVLEFLQKGALGPNDEVCSGNGYWFYIKEKELVDKYLHGDVPQGYNPISEAISVLNRRLNPEKTTSINSAPANKIQNVKVNEANETAFPAEDDLEFPDSDITVVGKAISLDQLKNQSASEEMKLPDQSDLEFPDVTIVTGNVKDRPVQKMNSQVEITLQTKSPKTMQTEVVQAVAQAGEQITYPDDDNLEYPDMPSAHHSAKIENPKAEAKLEVKVEKTTKKEKVHSSSEPVHQEEKKLLHERKIKSSQAPTQAPPMPRSMPEELKKRNDNYLLYLLVILLVIIAGLFFYYWRTILNKPLLG